MSKGMEQMVRREQQRERLRQNVLAAWDHYQTTGLHLTAREADAWLAKL
jgi:predicted transcriptional regulator